MAAVPVRALCGEAQRATSRPSAPWEPYRPPRAQQGTRIRPSHLPLLFPAHPASASARAVRHGPVQQVRSPEPLHERDSPRTPRPRRASRPARTLPPQRDLLRERCWKTHFSQGAASTEMKRPGKTLKMKPSAFEIAERQWQHSR